LLAARAFDGIHLGEAEEGEEHVDCSGECEEEIPCACELYKLAMEHNRHQEYVLARRAFTRCLKLDTAYSRAWVSYAQMEKRLGNRARGRQILQMGLRRSPRDYALLQAWGLHELQEGKEVNNLMAYGLLTSSVKYNPKLSGVLKWKAVKEIGITWHALRARAMQRRQKIAVQTAATSDRNHNKRAGR